jgi:hypothetical protein
MKGMLKHLQDSPVHQVFGYGLDLQASDGISFSISTGDLPSSLFLTRLSTI